MSLLRRPATENPRWLAGRTFGPGRIQVVGRRPARAAVPPRAAMADLRWLTVVPVAAVAVLLLLSVVAPASADRIGLPVAVTGALFGVPHGAVDHLVPWWWASGPQSGGRTRGRSGTRRPRTLGLATFVVAYAVVAALALIALLAFPTPTLLVFFVLSAAHFGRGEVLTAAERAGRPVPSASADWGVAAGFGIAVVGLLLWARPAQTNPLLGPLSPWLAEMALRTRTVGLLAVAAAVAVGLVVLLRAGRRLEAAELALVAATFAVAPPLAAFGVYFGAWHAVRHTGRLLDLARGRGRALGRPDTGWWPAGLLLLRSAALPTAAALSTVLALWLLRDLASFQAEVGVLLALTFPHAGVVWALDRHESALEPRVRR